MENKHNSYDLAQMQSLPLSAKIRMTQQRIKEWYESWVKFEIYNEKTKKTRYATINTNNAAEPPLKENEYIVSAVDGAVYISFSGGKDSTVLLDIARKMYPDIPAVFSDTGLEFPELRDFVKTQTNVTWVKPAMNFKQVIQAYGYPMISKEVADTLYYAKQNLQEGKMTVRLQRVMGTYKDNDGNKSKFNCSKWAPLLEAPFTVGAECCTVMKKNPLKKYEKDTLRKPITAVMASESRKREMLWRQYGCNAFDADHPMSKPMSFWTENDVLQYLSEYELPYASVYGDIVKDDDGNYSTTGYNRTGCVFCGFGCHLEKEPNRFQMLKQTHPKLWDYCMRPASKGGLGMREVLEFIHVDVD